MRDGDGGGSVTAASMWVVCNAARAAPESGESVAAVLDALKKSVVAVVGEIGEIGGGELTTSLAILEQVLSVSPSSPAAVETAPKILGVVEQCRRVFEVGDVAVRDFRSSGANGRPPSHRGALTTPIKHSSVVGKETVKILCKLVSCSNQNDRNNAP